MQQRINGNSFEYISNPLKNDELRDSYFTLVKKVFNLDFSPWYRSGFCGDTFTPYTLFDGGRAVASAGVSTGDFRWQNRKIKYAQLSTVMTDPEYRGMGLNKWLITQALQEWQKKNDLVYLYANDSVVDFYPKFGFETAAEYVYRMPAEQKQGTFRKLNLDNPDDIALLTGKYQSVNNPFSALTMENNLYQMMFHCVTFLNDDIYYVEEFDAIVIAEYDKDEIFCYDIYTGNNCSMSDIINILAAEQTKTITWGFTPKDKTNCSCEKSAEKDTTVFTLRTDNNILLENQVSIPFLSRA